MSKNLNLVSQYDMAVHTVLSTVAGAKPISVSEIYAALSHRGQEMSLGAHPSLSHFLAAYKQGGLLKSKSKFAFNLTKKGQKILNVLSTAIAVLNIAEKSPQQSGAWGIADQMTAILEEMQPAQG